jgi:hypothetical protein
MPSHLTQTSRGHTLVFLRPVVVLQELTFGDNSTPPSILLSIKESQCEDILPVSGTDGGASSNNISLALPPTLSVIYFQL